MCVDMFRRGSRGTKIDSSHAENQCARFALKRILQGPWPILIEDDKYRPSRPQLKKPLSSKFATGHVQISGTQLTSFEKQILRRKAAESRVPLTGQPGQHWQNGVLSLRQVLPRISSDGRERY